MGKEGGGSDESSDCTFDSYRTRANISGFCKLTFSVHILIAQGGFIFLMLYKSKGWKDSLKRAGILFVSWVLLNVLFDGCPLTHIENLITHAIYGVWPMPGYHFEDSWVGQTLKVSSGS